MWESSGELIEDLKTSNKVHVNIWSIFLSFQVTSIICGVHNTDHFTIQVVHLWCFVLIKFNFLYFFNFFLLIWKTLQKVLKMATISCNAGF